MKIPEPSGNATKKKRVGTKGGLPVPQESDGGGFDYLKAEDVGEVGDTAKLKVLGPPEASEDSEFSDAFMPVSFKGKTYSFGIKWSKPNYRKLYEQFGKNPKKWRGMVKVEVKHFKNNDYVAVV